MGYKHHALHTSIPSHFYKGVSVSTSIDVSGQDQLIDLFENSIWQAIFRVGGWYVGVGREWPFRGQVGARGRL